MVELARMHPRYCYLVLYYFPTSATIFPFYIEAICLSKCSTL